MEEKKLLQLMNLFSYERYMLPNSRSDASYVYPVIMPIEGCGKQKAECKKEFFSQQMYPLMEKNDTIEYGMEDVLVNLAVGTHGLTKYEIDSPYKFHRPVPSARGIHPCELYFFSQNGVKRYNPQDNCFDFLWGIEEEKVEEFSIVIAADDWRLAKYYGDFAYVLGALDAGHIIGQLAVLAVKSGCYMDVIYSKAQIMGQNNVASFFEEQGLLVYASVLIRKERKIENVPKYSQMTGYRRLSYQNKIKLLRYREILIGLKKMKLLCEKPDRLFVPQKQNAHLLSEERGEPIGKILKERTSAHSHLGLMSVGHIDNIYKKLLWMAAELEVYMQKTDIFPYVNVYLFLNEECEQLKKGYYRLEQEEKQWDTVRKIDNIREEWFRIIHDSHEFLNVQGIPLVFLVSINIQGLMKKYGDRTIDAMYMYSGEIGQILSLLVTRYGMFCRPIKNICEEKLEDFFLINRDKERITYAMLVGKKNISQQKLDMDIFGEKGEENE